MKASKLTKKKFHFPLLVVVDLIKQVNLWWGLTFRGREFAISIFRAWH
jgi:hypothetical protein